MNARRLAFLILTISLSRGGLCPAADGPPRLRLMVETDAGGDPDDEQSLVRFLVYTNEWDVEGILCNRPAARKGENLNTARTGLGVVQKMVAAYGASRANLHGHDPRYPTGEHLMSRTVPGYKDTDQAVRLIIDAVDSADPRPLWFCDWGSDHGSDETNLKRALDKVRKKRGEEGYARFKSRLRLSSHDAFGEHTRRIAPPFPLWVDTFRPEMEGKRWYHRFSALTAKAGGFDLRRDVLTGHGPLGELYPTNTTSGQKEGDSMTFLYLVPTGMNDPERPELGGWAGRYGRNGAENGRAYFHADQEDTWNGTTSRDNTLARWASHLQNDFRARMDWCVTAYGDANHPPAAKASPERPAVKSGARVELDAAGSTDPDGDRLRFEWIVYPETGTWHGPAPVLTGAGDAKCLFTAPEVTAPADLHVILQVTDTGVPPLTRYARIVVGVSP